MFNGIIKNKGKVAKIIKEKKNIVIFIKSNLSFKNDEIGSSIACSGACLTLDKFYKKTAQFFISKETLNKTNFKNIKKNDVVNLE